MPQQYLPHRIVLRIYGKDATSFLQNLVTTNVENLQSDSMTPCALLTPQGKIAFDFLIGTSASNDFLIDMREDLAPAFQKRIQLYKLRADVAVDIETDIKVSAVWGSEVGDAKALRDLRFPESAIIYRHYGAEASVQSSEEFDKNRIEHGVAESGSDYEINDIFPHDIYFDLNQAIDFKKGCYVGQEVISRMQHRGSARKRVCIIRAQVGLPDNQDTITAGGKIIGQLGTIDRDTALGIIRVDRLLSAQDASDDIMVGEIQVDIHFPEWVGERYLPIKVESAF